ncbi:MAG: hypothetical protein HZB42_11545 [Sphingobacteriales bacterium]|nr:hypothetical protein [Sphingobacteriales bacterium]
MKKIFLIVTFALVAKTSTAQFNTQLVVIPNPPGALADWDNKTLTYLVSGGIGLTAQVIVKATIKTVDGEVVATKNLAKAPIIIAGSTNLILYVNDVMPLPIMIFNGKYKSSMDKSGKLPAGSYQLCVQLVNPTDYRIMSEEKCRIFNLASYQLPIPVMPASETILDLEKAQSVITFRWTPVTPNTGMMLTYRVTVFEILPGQTAMQALRSNQPLLAKDIVGTTQYIWQPQLGMTQCCTGDPDFDLRMKKDTTRKTINPDLEPDVLVRADTDVDAYAFIWTIQTFDSQRRPFGDGNVNGDGISEPNVFFVDRRPAAMRRSGPPARSTNLTGKKN